MLNITKHLEAPFTGDIEQFATEETRHRVYFLFPVLAGAESLRDVVASHLLPAPTHGNPFCRKQERPRNSDDRLVFQFSEAAR